MTLIIENVKDEFIPAFKGLAKSINATITTKKPDKANKWQEQSKQMIRDYKAGKIKGFKSIQDLREDLES